MIAISVVFLLIAIVATLLILRRRKSA
jgi:hypothetical protein